MKSKIFSIAVFILVAYLLPLTGNATLVATPQVAILSVFVVVLLATQPPLNLTDAKADKDSDKNSVIMILAGYLLSQVAVITEWGYINQNTGWLWDWPAITGLTLMAGGMAFRVWCIRTLGKFFTATVRTQEKQTIITSGAYRVVRHPSYFGAFIAAIGSAVFMHAPLALAVTTIVLFTAYYFRIKAEEETLMKEFGQVYETYRSTTRKLVPYVY